ncbi:MAG: PAS domain S-box protein [Actinomycetes bacterium]
MTGPGLESSSQTGGLGDVMWEMSVDMLAVANGDGFLTAVSPSWEKVLGYSPAELTARPYIDFVHPDDVATTMQAAAALLEPGETTVGFENRYRRKDGQYRWLAWTARVANGGQQAFCIARDVTEYKQLEQRELTASEQRFQAMFDNHDAVMLLIDPVTGQIVDANAAAAAFYGYSADELRSMSISAINVLPAAEVAARRAEALTGDRGYFVFPHRLANGQIRTVEVHSSPIYDHGRQLLFSIIRDVTQREEYESRLRKAAAIFDSTLEAVIITDAEGLVEQVNPAYTKLTGWKPDDVLGKPVLSLSGAMKSFEDPDRLREAASKKSRPSGEYTIQVADGSDCYVLIGVNEIVGPMDEITGYVGVMTDISDRVRAERKLAEAEQRYRLVAENTGGAVFLVSAAGELTWVSPSTEQLLGYTADELIGHSGGWLVHPDDLAAAKEGSHQESGGVELRFRHKDGEYRWMAAEGKVVTDPGGTVVGRVDVLRDINEQVVARQLLAERAAELSRLKAELVTENERLAQVMEGTRLGLWDWNMVTGETVFDERWAEIIGYRLAELEPVSIDTWVRFSHPDDLALSDEQIKRHSEGALPHYDIEVRMRHKDGRWIWVRDRGKIVEWSCDGRPLRMTGTHEDVTDLVLARQALAESERRYRLLAENGTDMVYLVNPAGVFTWASPATSQLLGYTPADLVGTMKFQDLVHPDDLSVIRSVISRIEQSETRVMFELRLRTAAGEYRWMSGSTSRAFDVDGTPLRSGIGSLRDINEQVEAQLGLTATAAALEESERTFHLAMEGSPQGMAIISPDLRFQQVNPALCSMLGKDETWLLSHSVRDVIDPDDLVDDLADRAALLAGDCAPNVRECRWLKSDGSPLWVVQSTGLLRDEAQLPLFYVTHVHDNTEAHRHQEWLSHRASHDSLTGLLNREELQERIGTVLATRSQFSGTPALLFCDLDYFKDVNDTYGHAVGDEVLRITAERISASLRVGDEVTRLGGDEFVVVLPEVPDLTAAAYVAEKVRRSVSEPIQISNNVITIQISVGIALATPTVDAHRLLRNADAALYGAKQAGRDRIATQPMASHLLEGPGL